MTKQEYDSTGWRAGMKAEYNGKIYDIWAANFPEYLVALVVNDCDDYIWVRCENVTIVGKNHG